MHADRESCSAHRDLMQEMMDRCIPGQQRSIWTRQTSSWEREFCRIGEAARRGRKSCCSGRNCSRGRSYANFDAGFGIPVRKNPLRREVCSPAAPLQRITRSSRSRPSLHEMASKCACSRCTRVRMEERTGAMGCGAWSTHLGDNSHAVPCQPPRCRASTSTSKNAPSQCEARTAAAQGGAHRRLLSVRVIGAVWA
jgi:hypothetical protein